MANLKFVPFDTFIDPAFWAELSRRKLDVYKLDESVRELIAFYVNTDQPGAPCRLTLDSNAFVEPTAIGTSGSSTDVHPKWMPRRAVACRGELMLFNTPESFANLDRKQLLEQWAQKLRNLMEDVDALDDVSVLAPFVLTAYVNLKKHHFYYWVLTPALTLPSELNYCDETIPKNLADVFDNNQLELVSETVLSFLEMNNYPAAFILHQQQQGGTNVSFRAIKFSQALRQPFQPSNLLFYLVFVDPSTFAEHPGWPLRNLLACWTLHHRHTQLAVIGLRLRAGCSSRGIDISTSVLWNIKVGVSDVSVAPTCVGWEKNQNGKLAPRFIDMSATLDPVKLSDSAVQLNLQLMRWRLVPSLDLDRIANCRCLLFGAGTLGCYVARALMAWGVRQITFIDNARVSYSNPVRQSLYSFVDASSQTHKATTAAAALRQIHPGVIADGHCITIPMPGHIIPKNETGTKKTYGILQTLDDLVQSHDVVFLLMDTREGRWFPTVLAAVYGKIAVSVALGFDSYVVIRHGCRPTQGHSSDAACSSNISTANASRSSGFTILSGEELGCYFCSDITAPGNSTTDRTLDQQCTVTRPGVSLAAAGLAVELLSSMLQHPDGAAASTSILTSSSDDDVEEDASHLGAVPHQVRGHVSRFTQMTTAVRRFDSCIACSEPVLERYKRDKFDFVIDACNNPNLLEELTGLTELHKTANDVEVWDFDDAESVVSMEAI